MCIPKVRGFTISSAPSVSDRFLFISIASCRSGEASRLESAIATAAASQSFIEQLASAGDDDRERMLMEWMKQRDDGEVSKPIVSTRKRRTLVEKEEVEEDKLDESSSLPEVRAFFFCVSLS